MPGAGATFHLVDLAVEVQAEPGVLDALRSLWRGALTPLVPAISTRRLEARAVGGAWELWSGGERVARTDAQHDVLPLLEEELADLVHLWSRERGRAVLHAAGFVIDGQPIVAVGDSGAGKSTLALAAVRKGAALLSDEWIVADGAQLHGVPRAIQFEPIPAGAALPSWLEGVVVSDATFPGHDGRQLVVPHQPVEAVHGPVALDSARLVVLARAPRTELAPLEPVEALAALLEAQRVRQPVSWERLSHHAARLSWSDGPSALEALLSERPPAARR